MILRRAKMYCLENKTTEEKKMTIKYCPHCGKLGNTRVMAHYIQVPCQGILVKQRRIVHMVEDGGCGLTWYTGELPFDMLDQEAAGE
jgi:hypothetical protein